MKLTGNFAWCGSNGIYWVEVEKCDECKKKHMLPIFPRDYGLEKWQALRAMKMFIKLF